MNNKLTLVAGVAITSVSLYSATLSAATVQGTADAFVLTPLSIAAGANMDFGNIAGDADIDTHIVLDASTGNSNSADGASVDAASVAGVFTVTGSGSLLYTIDAITDTTLTGTGDPMALTAITDSLGGSGALLLGTQSFTVGGTLTLNAGQLGGAYAGNYDVTVNYQ